MEEEWIKSIETNRLEIILAELLDGWQHEDFDENELIKLLEIEIRKRKLKKISE